MRWSVPLGLALLALPVPAAAAGWTFGTELGAVLASDPHAPGPGLALDLAPELGLLGGRLSPTIGVSLATVAGTGEVEVPGAEGTGTWHLRTSWVAPSLGARLALTSPEGPTIPELGLSGGLCLARTTSWTGVLGERGSTAVDGAAVPCGRVTLGMVASNEKRQLGATLGLGLMPLESPLMSGSLRVLPSLAIVYRRRKG